MIRCLLHAVLVAIMSSEIAAEEPVTIAREDGKQPFKQPQVACGTDGSIHVAYGAGDAVLYSHSSDGQSFTTPVGSLPLSQSVARDASRATHRGRRYGAGHHRHWWSARKRTRRRSTSLANGR